MTADRSLDITELYRRAAGGDSAAEELLFRELSARFQLIARHRVQNCQDCEEITQSALASVVKHYRSINIEVSFFAWARKVLNNRIIDHYKTNRARYESDWESVAGQMASAGMEADPMLRTRLLECLHKVNTVNGRHARVLVLKYLGYDTEEICRRVQLTRSNAYSMLSRARAMLQRCLEKGNVGQ